jgi:hypothetical protein
MKRPIKKKNNENITLNENDCISKYFQISRVELNGAEWNKASISLFEYFMMERNKVFIPLFGK